MSETSFQDRRKYSKAALIGTAVVGIAAVQGIFQILGVSVAQYFRLPDRVDGMEKDLMEVHGEIRNEAQSSSSWHMEVIASLSKAQQKLDDISLQTREIKERQQ